MKDFAGRTAFVTGGANGVGIGLVRALLAQGCNVAIADIRPASIEAALPDAVTVWGSQDLDEREARIIGFSDGEYDKLSFSEPLPEYRDVEDELRTNWPDDAKKA